MGGSNVNMDGCVDECMGRRIGSYRSSYKYKLWLHNTGQNDQANQRGNGEATSIASLLLFCIFTIFNCVERNTVTCKHVHTNRHGQGKRFVPVVFENLTKPMRRKSLVLPFPFIPHLVTLYGFHICRSLFMRCLSSLIAMKRAPLESGRKTDQSHVNCRT